MNENIMQDLVSLCKRRGIIFPGSEIYGGLANTWDYGPLGVEMKNNIKHLWWKTFVHQKQSMVGLDSGILLNPRVWEASGHVGGFSDPLMDCRDCKTRHRADKLLEENSQSNIKPEVIAALNHEELRDMISQHKIKCPECGSDNFTEIRSFNLMFETNQGVTDDSSSKVYMRPETAQGIFINFKNIQQATRKKLPFGVAQIGKSFRNEITPGNFIFRTREFEQMEIEFFCFEEGSLDWHKKWVEESKNWLLNIGLNEDSVRLRVHDKDELSHYSQATTDIEFLFPFGWGELWGIAHRGEYDLSKHIEFSGKDLKYIEPEKKIRIIPHVIEPSLGVERLMLAILCDAYKTEKVDDLDTRIILSLDARIAPVQVAVMPLSKKLSEGAHKLSQNLLSTFRVEFDENGSIGKRYRRHDEIGTPFCLTFDFDSLADQQVTVRNRDTMSQERVSISQLTSYLSDKITKQDNFSV